MLTSIPGKRLLFLTTVSVMVAVSITSCSSVGRRSLQHDEVVARDLRQRGLDPKQIILPFGLTDEMRQWAIDNVLPEVSRFDQLDDLRVSLLDPGQMSLEYEWGYTGTAIEVFEQRRANCLAFTNLFVGLARELGISVYFMLIDDFETYRKQRDLVVVSDHVAVGFGAPVERKIYDFSENPPENYRQTKPISDLTAIAMYHSNRGAELLASGAIGAGIHWLETAVQIDPELANAWVNLGVALRRVGERGQAEEKYKKALEINPRLYSAYHNLASLLRLEDREQEAEAYEQALGNSPNRNPFTYLALGDISLDNGEVERAERFYRRAVNLATDNAEVYAALGQLAVSTGDLRTARRMLRRAQRINQADLRTQRLAELLEKAATDQQG